MHSVPARHCAPHLQAGVAEDRAVCGPGGLGDVHDLGGVVAGQELSAHTQGASACRKGRGGEGRTGKGAMLETDERGIKSD